MVRGNSVAFNLLVNESGMDVNPHQLCESK